MVFVSKEFDYDGYARNLRNRIKVASPLLIDVDNLILQDWMSAGKTKEECIFGWGMESESEDYDYI